MSDRPQKNIYGDPLAPCCGDPLTGFYRDGYCHTGDGDHGLHVVCAEMTGEFLEFSRSRGNDLMTPRPEYGFPGLKPGDHWCLCALRWKEAHAAGYAPRVRLSATHENVLHIIPRSTLEEFGT